MGSPPSPAGSSGKTAYSEITRRRAGGESSPDSNFRIVAHLHLAQGGGAARPSQKAKGKRESAKVKCPTPKIPCPKNKNLRVCNAEPRAQTVAPTSSGV